MDMRARSTCIYCGLWGILVAIFTVIFLILLHDNLTLVRWLSYGFILFASMVVLGVYLSRVWRPSEAEFGFPLYMIALAYLGLEVLTGAIFIVGAFDDVDAVVVVQLVLLGALIIGMSFNIVANGRTKHALQKDRAQNALIKGAADRVKLTIGMVEDAGARRWVEKAYDVLHASPIQSDDTLCVDEMQMLDAVGGIEQLVASSASSDAISKAAQRLIVLTEQRNQKLMHLNMIQ